MCFTGLARDDRELALGNCRVAVGGVLIIALRLVGIELDAVGGGELDGRQLSRQQAVAPQEQRASQRRADFGALYIGLPLFMQAQALGRQPGSAGRKAGRHRFDVQFQRLALDALGVQRAREGVEHRATTDRHFGGESERRDAQLAAFLREHHIFNFVTFVAAAIDLFAELAAVGQWLHHCVAVGAQLREAWIAEFNAMQELDGVDHLLLHVGRLRCGRDLEQDVGVVTHTLTRRRPVGNFQFACGAGLTAEADSGNTYPTRATRHTVHHPGGRPLAGAIDPAHGGLTIAREDLKGFFQCTEIRVGIRPAGHAEAEFHRLIGERRVGCDVECDRCPGHAVQQQGQQHEGACELFHHGLVSLSWPP